MKKLLLLPLGTLLLCALCACSNLNPTKQTPHEQLCSELKNDIVFNNAPNSFMDTSNAGEKTEAMRLYEKNGCDKL